MISRTLGGSLADSTISSGERLTLGQAFFPEAGCGGGEGDGVSAGVADGLSSGAGVADGFLCFDLLFGVGPPASLCEALRAGLGDGVGEAFFRFGEVSGGGVGVAFFFRCLRAGVGEGSKTFWIFVPSDSSAACAGQAGPSKIARIKGHFMIGAVPLRL